MDTSKSQCAKQLKELLKQDQDEFSMQNYFIERSYMFKNCNTHRIYSTKNLKWCMKYDLQKIRKRLLHATGVLRSTLQKFISTVDDDDEHYRKATQQRDRAFSKRFGMCHSFSDVEVEDMVFPCENYSSIEDMFETFTLHNLIRPQVNTGNNPYWIKSKENPQQYYNRESEWREQLSTTVRRKKVKGIVEKATSDTVLITYLRKLLVNSNLLKCKSTRRKKVKGIVEKSSLCRRNRELYQNESKKVPSKLVCEVREITKMLHKDSCVVSEEWKTFQIVSLKILADIGDSIIDDIVREIIYLF